MSEKELSNLIKRQIAIENEHVKRLTQLEEKVDTAAARLLLMEMRLDSTKHSGILGGILEIINNLKPSQTLWTYQITSYVDKLAVKKELENHVALETEVLSHVEEELQHTKDVGLKLLLQHIAEDEKKHHRILETIVKNSYKISP